MLISSVPHFERLEMLCVQISSATLSSIAYKSNPSVTKSSVLRKTTTPSFTSPFSRLQLRSLSCE